MTDKTNNEISIAQIFALKEATAMRKLAENLAQDTYDIAKIQEAFSVSDDELQESLYAILGKDEGERFFQYYQEVKNMPLDKLPQANPG